MSNTTPPQKEVIVNSASEASVVPFGYEIVMRGASELSDEVFEEPGTLEAPTILDNFEVVYRNLPDSTTLADINLVVSGSGQDIELRFTQGESI